MPDKYNYSEENIRRSAALFWERGKGNSAADPISECIRLAYRDLTPRTMTLKAGVPKVDLKELAEGDAALYAAVSAWMNGETEDFADWHKKACGGVIAHLKTKYQDRSCTVGKGQKIVNMTMKNLYALYVITGRDLQRLQECHMPLDRYTLEWFCRIYEGQEGFCDGKFFKGRVDQWSNIKEYGSEEEREYRTGDKRFYTYHLIQKKIREHLAQKNVTPLQAECVVWPNIQLELAAEEFYFQLLSYKGEQVTDVEKKKFVECSVDEKINRIRAELEQENT